MKFRSIVLLILLFVFQECIFQTDRKSEKVKEKLEGLWLFDYGKLRLRENYSGKSHVSAMNMDEFFLDSLLFKKDGVLSFSLNPIKEHPGGSFSFNYQISDKGESIVIKMLDLNPDDTIPSSDFIRPMKLKSKNKLMINFPISSIDYGTGDTIRTTEEGFPIYFRRSGN